MNLIKTISLGIVVFLLGLSAMIFFISTTSGLHFILKMTACWIPKLEMASFNGGWDNLTIKQLRYQVSGITLYTSELHLSINFSYLLHRKLCINDISLRDVTINVHTSTLNRLTLIRQNSLSKSVLSTPYSLILRHLTLNKLRMQVDKTLITLDKFSTGFIFYEKNLIITPTRITGLLVTLPSIKAPMIADTIIAADKKEIIRSHSCTIEKKYGNFTELVAMIRAQLPFSTILPVLFSNPLLLPISSLTTLPLNLTLNDLNGENLQVTGATRILVTRLRLQGNINTQHAALILLHIVSPQVIIHATGSAELTGFWSLHLTVNTMLHGFLKLEQEKIKLVVTGNLCDELKLSLNLSGPITIHMTLITHLSQAGFPLLFILETQSIPWPLIGTPQYQVKRLSLQLNGTICKYRLMLRALLKGKNLPTSDITLDAKGNPYSFTLSFLRIKALQGNIDVSASVYWKRDIIGHSTLFIKDINTARQWPKWPMRLNGTMTIISRLYDNNHWKVQVPKFNFQGYIQKHAFTANGTLIGNAAGQWQVPYLRLSFDKNRLMVTGELNHTLAVDAVLKAPVIKNMLLGLNDRIIVNIKLRGNLHKPQFLIHLDTYSIQWKSWKLWHISLQSHVFSTNIVQNYIQSQLNRLNKKLLSLTQFMVDLSTKNEKQHEIKVII